MRGVVLPGRRTVAFRDVPEPEPAYGQALIRVRASGLCGSDLRVIYRREPGDATPYRDGVIAGHEPAGQVVAAGPGVRAVAPGDRVAVYHIAGCGQCYECRAGRHVACTSPDRAAYGYHRDGGHAPYLLAEERSLVRIPDGLSFADGALASCGFGTAYQALVRAEAGARHRVLVTGLGPLGLAVAMLAAALGADVAAEDPNPLRRDLAASVSGCRLGAAGGEEFEVAIDCSGTQEGRLACLHAARRRGTVVFLGEGGTVRFEPSPLLIHKELRLLGSWVCDLTAMADLFAFCARRGVRPEAIVTHRLGRDDAAAAYRLFDEGKTGKVIIE